jgi:signal transduction histidine kinase/CheY-like chemotaxis protein
MPLKFKISKTNLPAWPLFPAIILAGLLNYYSLSFFAGSELIFGNVIAVVVLFVYGVTPAVIISIVAGTVTYLTWGNLFSIPPFLLEILVLNWAIKSRRNPVYAGILYWVSIGWVLVGIEFFMLSDFGLLTKYAITIKYLINGLINVLVGYQISQFVTERYLSREFVRKQEISVLLTNQLFSIVTVVVIILSFFWLNAFEREELNDYEQRLQIKADHVSTELENQIIGHQKSLTLTALNNRSVDPVEIQRLLQHLKDTYPSISTLIGVDKNGEIIASAPSIVLPEGANASSINVSDRPYFYEVKNSGKPFVSDVFRGRGFGTAPIIAISVPLIHDQGFVGILEASLDLELLKTVDKKEIGPKEGLLILDRSDRVIYASDNLRYEFLDDLSDLKLIQHLSMPDTYFIEDEIGNQLIVKSANSKFLGWRTISTIPLSDYHASTNRYMTITLSLLGIFIVLSFYLARWIVQVVTTPINTLSKALSDAQNAEDLRVLELTRGAQELIEIANVEEKLNEFSTRSKQLVSELRQANINQDAANEQLLDLNESLEQIVESKTKELNSALKIANDASDAKDEAKQAAERTAQGKSEFLATMSHEIRTPMNGVLGMAELLNATTLTVTQKDYVETILNSGNLLLTIINDVLVYSKLEAGKVELEITPINLEHLLHEVLEVMSWSLTKNIELVLDYPPTMPTMFMGDADRLSQVLFNLVDNAIKFTEQGSVSIQAGYVGGLLTLAVKDTGIGITQKQQEVLFESFNQADTSTTRKYGGTGLGLAICKKIINLMNGKIAIQSEYGKGTSFLITLNLETQEKPFADKVFDSTNILIVESSDNHFSMYSNLLHHYGAHATQCISIEKMMEQLLNAGAEGAGVDLVLLSENLLSDQERRYGNELRSHPVLNKLPLVILSPSSNKASLEHYFDCGFSAYLTKPVRSDLFVTILHAALKNGHTDSLITKHSLSDQHQSSAVNIQFSGHILLVEDVLTNQVVATTMLHNMGLTVDLAEDGLQAITKWQNKHYDLIFMDCRMPNMDGYEATKHIRANEIGKSTPIIALTANVTEEDRIKCHDSGMNAVVMKPFKPSHLHDILSEWLPVGEKVLAASEVAQTEFNQDSFNAIDLEVFENTQQLLGDAFPELVGSIFSDVDNILDKLSSWADHHDIEGLALLPHSMKSTSAYIGASKLNQLAADSESDARAGNIDKALSHVGDMKQTYAEVVKELAMLGYTKSS